MFNSVAGVGGAVNDAVSKLTFDNKYQMKRKRRKNKAIADQGGVCEGFRQVTVGPSTELALRHHVKLFIGLFMERQDMGQVLSPLSVPYCCSV